MIAPVPALELPVADTAHRLADELREVVLHQLRRRGLVVAISGGVDSACVAALAVTALGAARVHGLLLPERESSGDSTRLGAALCDRLAIERTVVDVSPALEAVGCYQERDRAVAEVFPGYVPGMPWKMVLDDDRLTAGRLSVFKLVVDTGGGLRAFRLPPDAYLRIVAATNFKQRVRAMLAYFHADLRHFAVAGTPNRLEYELGFFVKLGDGAADVKPIARLYKTQVYALARHLGVPPAILDRPPTTDTFSLPQTQQEFYFSIDLASLDLLLWAKDRGRSVEEAATLAGMDPGHVRHVYEDIDRKRRTASYLHAAPALLGEER